MNTIRRRLFLLALAAASLLSPLAARAQTVIDHLPYIIGSSGTYVLNSNLNSSQTSGNLITVNASNVTIDFQNHYIAGPSTIDPNQTLYGVYAFEQSNLTVKNGTIAFCLNGIEIEGNNTASTNSVDHQIDNVRATYCYYAGISILYSPASRVTNCQVSQTGYASAGSAIGILINGAGVTVQGNVVSNVLANSNAVYAAGIYLTTGSFARQNTVAGASKGVFGGKYQDNLTANCTTPFSGGTDAGGNN